ncbi:MAG: hypothetical protein Q9162_007900 [Coniocarpon cinnabarinum]
MWGYISDDDERPRSPGLQEVKVKYQPSSPRPFVPRRRPMPDSGTGGHQRSRKRGRGHNGRRIRPSQGDVVLLGHLDPNRPDIAAAAGRQTFLPSDSASDRAGTNDDTDEEIEADEGKLEREKAQDDTYKVPGGGERQGKPTASNQLHSKLDYTSPADDQRMDTYARSSRTLPSDEERAGLSDGPNKVRRFNEMDSQFFCPSCDKRSSQCIHNNTRKEVDGVLMSQYLRESAKYEDEEISRAKLRDITLDRSPRDISKYPEAITSSPKAATRLVVESQPWSYGHDQGINTEAFAPNPQDQSLPSIHHLIGVAEQGRPRTESTSSISSALASSNVAYAAPGTPSSASNSGFYPAKAAQQSLPSFPPVGRTATDPTPLPLPVPSGLRHTNTNPANFAMQSTSSAAPFQTIPSNASVTSTSTVGATPNSATDAPTPSDRSTTLSLPVSPVHTTHPGQGPQMTIGSGPSALYKCPHPGCQAPPFQTPYLLNSHRNVHSSDRPYFCPRKDCPRSQPGKGFKRKNEMLRHGLVHDSPGYVCPFCSPEKEHRYPRPDNLQRHVKMHHEDVDTEDPRLREVLGQRRTTIPGSGVSVLGGSMQSSSLITDQGAGGGPATAAKSSFGSETSVMSVGIQRLKPAAEFATRDTITVPERGRTQSGAKTGDG